ncbi:class I adenylate-forming enzyme family protein [Streptosporangium sp. G11]|uniref:class I adenylate-forming enzyme family protein n=1 Tax=Streptosporangium sp. G11 TaxID=3436926 RepID=UPI003EBF7AEE
MTTPAPRGPGTPGSEPSGPGAPGRGASGSGSWGAGPGGSEAGGPRGPYARDGWGALLRAAVRRFDGRTAMVAHGERRTYRELGANAARLANALHGLGVRPGDRVALMAEDRVEALEAYAACAFGGFTAVHVNDRLRAGEVQAIVDDADVRAFLHTDGRTEVAEAIAGPGILISAGREPARGALRYADLLAGASDRLPEPGPGGFPAVIGYTSGTTGEPKGVVVEDATLARIIRHMPFHYRLEPGGMCAFTGTFSFVAGLWGVILPHLYLGGTLSFMAGLAPDAWVDAMVRERSAFTYVPSPLAPAFVAEVRRRPEVLGTLRTVLHSASALPPDLVREMVDLVGTRYVETWGMTETGAPVTATTAADWGPGCEADDIHASVGRPMPVASVRVLDEAGEPLPPGAVGELAVESDTLFAGYHNRPDVTAEAFTGSWFRTGDAGRVDEAGYVYVTDRIKDMIITGGMNVYPAELEKVLAGMPGLAEAAVFGTPHERWGEAVTVAVTPSPGAAVTGEDVIRFLAGRVAGYKKPSRVFVVDELPRNAARKVRKELLRQRFQVTDGSTGP